MCLSLLLGRLSVRLRCVYAARRRPPRRYIDPMRILLAFALAALTSACNSNPCALEPCPAHLCPPDACAAGYHVCQGHASPTGERYAPTCSLTPCDEFGADACDL